MMKKIIALGVIILCFAGVYRFFQTPSPLPQEKKEVVAIRSTTTPTVITPSMAITERSLFVPYWNPQVDEDTKNNYDTFIYFGIAANQDGSIKQDQGYENITLFQQSTIGKKQLLTIRMLDTDSNHAILEDEDKQQALLNGIVSIVEEYDFDGIVLDLEVSALPLTDVRNNITLFIQRVSDVMRDEERYFAATMYGDVYYRARPYDIKAIGNSVDELMIMTYDFHKSRGEPGPNFPFAGRSTYGYDFQAMIADFAHDIPLQKVTILLGMYGYDWTLGPQGKPLKGAKALPLSDIQDMIEPCILDKCNVSRESGTKETKVTYRDGEGFAHELWFEDDESAQVKINYLEKQGIGRVGYWVYGYF